MEKVNILGTEWTIKRHRRRDDPELAEADGYTDNSIRLIVVENMEHEKGCKLDLEQYAKVVMRHEIIHAFLYESGLDGCSHIPANWAQNEEMVDWFAIQLPKIFKAFEQAECL